MSKYREVLSEACPATITDTWSWTATKKMAQRKLDSVSFVNAYCCYANSELRIKRFKQAARLAASLAQIEKLTAEAEQKKKKLEANLMAGAAPDALRKQRSNGMNFDAIIVKELVSIAYCFYLLSTSIR